MPSDGTIARCATCKQAIYCWTDRPLLGVDEFDGQEIYIDGRLLPPMLWWTHFRNPADRHDAVPALSLITSFGRVLLCTGCHRPQSVDDNGWHCANLNCPGRVDND